MKDQVAISRELLDAAIKTLNDIDGWLATRNLSGLTPNEKLVLNKLKVVQGNQEGRSNAFKGPAKWTEEEIADNYTGIRWIATDGVHGRPTDHDVRVFLKRTSSAWGCTCDDCKKFYHKV
jgi:hypothetical protein